MNDQAAGTTEQKLPGSSIANGSTAQMFAVVCGILLTVAGVAALVVNFNFSAGSSIATERLLFMDVNGFSGLLMLITGCAMIVGGRSAASARLTCVVIGAIYLVVTLWSLLTASVLGVLPVNDLTAIVYAAVAVLSLTAGLGPDPRDV